MIEKAGEAEKPTMEIFFRTVPNEKEHIFKIIYTDYRPTGKSVLHYFNIYIYYGNVFPPPLFYKYKVNLGRFILIIKLTNQFLCKYIYVYI